MVSYKKNRVNWKSRTYFKKIFFGEFSTVIFISSKAGSVGPVQQDIKFVSPDNKLYFRMQSR